jgi:ATP-binding cassette subfamily C protein
MLRKALGDWVDHAVLPFLSTLFHMMSWKVGLALGLMVALSLIEGMGLLLLVPLLLLVGLDTQQGSLGAIDRLVSSVFTWAGRTTLSSVLVAFVLIVSAHGLLQRGQATISFPSRMSLWCFFGGGCTGPLPTSASFSLSGAGRQNLRMC